MQVFQISLVLTLVKTQQVLVNQIFGYYAGYSATNAVYSNFIGYMGYSATMLVIQISLGFCW
jgi:hypothetical protein